MERDNKKWQQLFQTKQIADLRKREKESSSQLESSPIRGAQPLTVTISSQRMNASLSQSATQH